MLAPANGDRADRSGTPSGPIAPITEPTPELTSSSAELSTTCAR